MEIGKTCLLVCEFIYWSNVKDDIEKGSKIAQHVLNFSKHNPKGNIMIYEIPDKPLETIGTDIFMLINKTQVSIVDYCSKF